MHMPTQIGLSKDLRYLLNADSADVDPDSADSKDLAYWVDSTDSTDLVDLTDSVDSRDSTDSADLMNSEDWADLTNSCFSPHLNCLHYF